MLDKIKAFWSVTKSVFGAVKDNIVAILGFIVALLVGWLLVEKSEKDAAQVQLEDEKDQKKIDKLDEDKSKNNGLLQAEEEKRKQIIKDMENKENEQSSPKDLVDYFNKSDSDK